jgi:hypothetical protein
MTTKAVFCREDGVAVFVGAAPFCGLPTGPRSVPRNIVSPVYRARLSDQRVSRVIQLLGKEVRPTLVRVHAMHQADIGRADFLIGSVFEPQPVPTDYIHRADTANANYCVDFRCISRIDC